MARAFAAKGIRVNAIAPGVIVTPFHDTTPPDILAICDEQNIPLFSTPLPAAQVIDFLRVYLSKKLAQRVIMHGVLSG